MDHFGEKLAAAAAGQKGNSDRLFGAIFGPTFFFLLLQKKFAFEITIIFFCY
jgi:hypothetical protein